LGIADVSSACAFWQDGRDGSSLLRGAARVLTGVPHYFEAQFITDYEKRARADDRALGYARALLDALAESAHRSPSEWATFCGIADQDFAGRGLSPNGEKDTR